MDLVEELRCIAAAFEAQNIRYALCGGLAMAVYGVVRATMDVDMLLDAADLPQALDIVASMGYDLPVAPMEFAAGAVRICRISKAFSGTDDLLSLDFLLVSDDLRAIWDTRQQIPFGENILRVVSRQGLADLKALRGSAQDLADIAALKEADNGS
ncbi:MAG: hypothetical protein ACLGQH_05955 [Acidobacteriota bacterium]